ncbi:MDR family MFS transporter [Methylorubrum thiocyanatum]|uniref:MDR family MFS transporter n=1 Tax=Methylorubrum thiocyanatum TaxID=47958 RepID=UPI00383A6940
MSEEKADAAAWLAVAAGTIGAFMATLDTSIVNSALPTIQGGIGAGADEGSWVSTAYLVAEIVMIPLAAWFEKIFGLRTFLLLATTLFVGFSVMCGTATGLNQMIIGRVGQGFSGGAMIPTALSIVATRLPPGQQAVGTALFGMTAVLGPVFGPPIGGWLTVNVSWHYTFFLNIPVGILLVGLVMVGLPHRETRPSLLLEADWLGILGLALGLGCLTVVLEDGQRERWFESELIVRLSVVSAVGFLMLLVGQFVSRSPVIDLGILLRPAFGGVFVCSLVVGAGVYGILYLIPQFLSSVPDYNAEQSGFVAMISGIPPLLLMPLFPLLVRRFDLRVMIAIGLVAYTVGCYVNASISPLANGQQFVLSQVLCGVGQAFGLLFLNQAATATVPRDKAEDASGLFNAARNLGGSFGIAMIKTMLERQQNLHGSRLQESVTANSVLAQEQVSPTMTPEAAQAALEGLKTTIDTQATVMSYGDLYLILAVLMAAALPAVLLIRPRRQAEP